MKTCIDANVLLETLLEGRIKANVATKYLSRVENGALSPLSAHLYVHFGIKEKHAVADLLQDLQAYRMLTMDEAVVRWAAANVQGNHFEDALQVASALLDGCDRFVTFDGPLAKNYGQFIDIQLLA